ncbi:hypothetical protein D1007_43811 [Hordeum vulgare]|nr:hypothetical protein D1007_43811 [Hordeum vulgare]
MEDLTPLGLWVQLDGCCNRPSWVAMEFNSLRFLFRRRRCKSFTISQGLRDGHVLHLKFYRATMLFMKVFGGVGGCLGFCMEDSGGDGGGSSNTDDSSNIPFRNGGRGDSDSDGSLGTHMKEEAYFD